MDNNYLLGLLQIFNELINTRSQVLLDNRKNNVSLGLAQHRAMSASVITLGKLNKPKVQLCSVCDFEKVTKFCCFSSIK